MNMKSSTPLTDTNEGGQNNIKYQKAIKQINKLISINTSVKKQLISLQEQYDCLRTDYSTLQQKYLTLQQTNSILMQQTSLLTMGRPTHSYDESLSQKQVEAANCDARNLLRDSDKKPRDNLAFSPLGLPNKQLQNTGTISEFMDTKRKLEQLQEKLTQKEETIKDMAKQLAAKVRQNSELYQKYIESTNNKKQLKNEQQLKETQVKAIEQLQQDKQILEKELQKSHELVAKLTNDCEMLKKINCGKLTSSQESGITNVKSLNVVSTHLPVSKSPFFGGTVQKLTGHVHVPLQNKAGFNSAQQSLQNSIQKTERCDPFSEYYFKKVRDLEAQNMKIKKQYEEKKIKYKGQISKLKQQITTKDANIQQINQFIAKQQAFIEQFVIKNETKDQPSQPGLLRKNKMVSSPQQYEKQKGLGSLGTTGSGITQNIKPIIKEGPFEKYNLKGQKNVNKNEAHLRTNTVQSEEYTMTQSQAQQNFGFSVQNKHKFVQGTKYYKN